MRRGEEDEAGEEKEKSVSKGAYGDEGLLLGEREGELEMPKELDRSLEPLRRSTDKERLDAPSNSLRRRMSSSVTLAKMSVALVLSCGLALRARGRDHQRADPSLLRGTPRERERDALDRLEDLPCRRDARAADDEADRLERVGLQDEDRVSACASAR